MFDISFWELTVIAIVALVVIGPERLPGVARSLGKWVGGMQRFVRSVKADIDAEISKNEELKSLIQDQEELKSTHEILENTISDLKEPTSVPRRSSTPSVKAIGEQSKPKPASPEVISETAKPSGSENKQSNG